MAIESAVLHIRTGGVEKAVACAGELPSRLFKAKRFEAQDCVRKSGRLSPDTDLLRWMLSDGAGAFLLEDKTGECRSFAAGGMDRYQSHAHLFDVCMYAGINKDAVRRNWLDYDSFSDADRGSRHQSETGSKPGQ